MASQNDTGFRTFIAAEALEPFRRVKISATANTVEYADGADEGIGVTQDRAASGGAVTVKMWNAPGTFKIEAGAATASLNDTLYGAADGKADVTDAGSDVTVGYNLDAASGSGSIIEVVKA